MITGFVDENEEIPSPSAVAKAAQEKSKAQAEGNSEESDDDFVDNGPDPELTAQNMEELRKLLSRYVKSIAKNGKKHATTKKHEKKLAEHFSHFKCICL